MPGQAPGAGCRPSSDLAAVTQLVRIIRGQREKRRLGRGADGGLDATKTALHPLAVLTAQEVRAGGGRYQ